MIRADRKDIVAEKVTGFAKFPCSRWHWQTYGCGHQPEMLCLTCFVKSGENSMEWEVLEAEEWEEMGVCRECEEIF